MATAERHLRDGEADEDAPAPFWAPAYTAEARPNRRRRLDRAARLRVAATRAEIDALLSAQPAAMLRVPPGVVRAVATRVLEARRAVAELRPLAHEASPLDVEAARAAMVSFQELRAARDRRDSAARDVHRLLAVGNGAALLWLLVAGALLAAGVPMASPAVSAAVALAAVGPLSALAVGAVRLVAATRSQRRSTAACSAALAAAGVETVGQLHARTFLLRAWSRRRVEASRAARVEQRAIAAWRALVGDDVDPDHVDDLLAAAARLRAAHLRLLAHHLVHLTAAAPRELPAIAPAVPATTLGSNAPCLDGRPTRMSLAGNERRVAMASSVASPPASPPASSVASPPATVIAASAVIASSPGVTVLDEPPPIAASPTVTVVAPATDVVSPLAPTTDVVSPLAPATDVVSPLAPATDVVSPLAPATDVVPVRPTLALVPAPPEPRPLMLWGLADTARRALTSPFRGAPLGERNE